jgi:hypothetical protein
MYHIHATLPYGATADCQCATLEELVAYLVEWLPLSSKVVCEETIPDCHHAGLMPDELCDICGGYAESEE